MLNKYKDWLEINGKSNSTIINYLARIKIFLKKIKLEDINEENILKFLLELKQLQSASTVNGYRASIFSFLTFLKKDVTLPKPLELDWKVPEFITEDFFKKDIIPVIDSIFRNPLKVKIVLSLMFYSGIRISEVSTIKRENIDLTNRTIKIYIKKRKREKIIYFTKNIKHLLEGYFSTESEEKNAFNISYIGIRNVFLKMKPYFKDINFHAHILRHGFATHLRKKGMKLEDIKELMGHKSILSTMRYAHSDTKILQKIYDEKMK